MDYLTTICEKGKAQEWGESLSHSLYEVCQTVEDGRKARGKRYELAALLVLIFLAKLAGETSVLGASEWLRLRAKPLCKRLGLSWKRMPCANTYEYALARLKSEEVNAIFADWLVRLSAEQRCGEEPSRLLSQPEEKSVHLAIDGKVLCGTGTQSYGGEEPQRHVLHVYEVKTGIVLAQHPISCKQSEVSALKPLLTPALCKGRILTADAAQSYFAFGRMVKQAGGDVILTIKDNTSRTRADLELFFEDPEADRSTWRTFEQWEKGHGRLERREMWVSPDLNTYFRKDWGEIGQVFRVQRERTRKGKKSVEVAYGLTTLSSTQASPQQVLSWLRAHWAIENRLHWRRDATLGEDRCGVRLPTAAHLLAVLNSLLLAVMDFHQISNVARQMRYFSARPLAALSWIVGSHDF